MVSNASSSVLYSRSQLVPPYWRSRSRTVSPLDWFSTFWII